jgi:hypothetical protein
MAQHFALDITQASFGFTRKTDAITAEATPTSLPATALDDTARVRSYWSAPSAASRPSISRSGRSITGRPSVCAPTCFCACSHTT